MRVVLDNMVICVTISLSMGYFGSQFDGITLLTFVIHIEYKCYASESIHLRPGLEIKSNIIKASRNTMENQWAVKLLKSLRAMEFFEAVPISHSIRTVSVDFRKMKKTTSMMGHKMNMRLFHTLFFGLPI